MIRVVTVEEEEIDPALLARLCTLLFQAYGIGCEPTDEGVLPRLAAKGPIDAEDFLDEARCAGALSDDKILFVTARPLRARTLPSGEVPTQSQSLIAEGRAIVSTHGLDDGDRERFVKRLGKHAIHEVGHLWGLHHCLDGRCALYPIWTPAFAAAELPQLCAFCREKSDAKIRLAKS